MPLMGVGSARELSQLMIAWLKYSWISATLILRGRLVQISFIGWFSISAKSWRSSGSRLSTPCRKEFFTASSYFSFSFSASSSLLLFFFFFPFFFSSPSPSFSFSLFSVSPPTFFPSSFTSSYSSFSDSSDPSCPSSALGGSSTSNFFYCPSSFCCYIVGSPSTSILNEIRILLYSKVRRESTTQQHLFRKRSGGGSEGCQLSRCQVKRYGHCKEGPQFSYFPVFSLYSFRYLRSFWQMAQNSLGNSESPNPISSSYLSLPFFLLCFRDYRLESLLGFCSSWVGNSCQN